MSIDRRRVLQGGLATLATLATGAGRLGSASASGVAMRSAKPVPGGSPAATAAVGASTSGRFPGDPGAGKLYYGAAVDASLGGVTKLESQLSHVLGVHRGYYLPTTTKGLVQQAIADHAAGRCPHVSTKVPGTWADVAAGKYDSWLGPLLSQLKGTVKPVLLTLHHEPENDAGAAGMLPQNYVAMQNHAVSLAATMAPNVTITPNLMQWTFDPRSGRKPSQWVPQSTRVFSSNVYNDWSPGSTLAWQPMSVKMAMVLPYTGGRPIVIGEYGCHTDPASPGRAAAWMTDAFNWAVANDVVCMSYFDSSQHSNFGSWVLDSERLGAMKTLVRRTQSVHL